eukprot:1771063-Amphidinium_carterae.1
MSVEEAHLAQQYGLGLLWELARVATRPEVHLVQEALRVVEPSRAPQKYGAEFGPQLRRLCVCALSFGPQLWQS